MAPTLRRLLLAAGLLALIGGISLRRIDAFPVLVTTDGDTAVHAMRDVHLAPEGDHGVIVGAEAGAESAITFLGRANVRVADPVGANADGKDLILQPGSPSGSGTPGGLEVWTPRSGANEPVRVLRVSEAKAKLDGALVADANVNTNAGEHTLAVTDGAYLTSPAALTVSHRLANGVSAPAPGIGVGVSFAAPLQGAHRVSPPEIARLDATLPQSTAATAEAELAVSLRTSAGAVANALTVSHGGTTARKALIAARPGSGSSSVPYVELQSQSPGAPSAFLFAGADGRLRVLTGSAPTSSADGNAVVLGSRRRRRVLLEEEGEGEEEEGEEEKPKSKIGDEDLAGDAPSSDEAESAPEEVITSKDDEGAEEETDSGESSLAPQKTHRSRTSAGVDDAVEDGLATSAKEESAAASKSHELLHLKAEHAKLEQLVARLREAFCAVSPHDETLCK